MKTATVFSSGFVTCLAAVSIACGGGGDDPAECRAVTVQVYGDSIGRIFGQALQIEADRARGAGRVLVEVRAVGGTSSDQLIAGTDGRNAPWPTGVGADVVLVNHGHNDRTKHVPVEAYADHLRQFAAVGALVLTPIPVMWRPDEGSGYLAAAKAIPGHIDVNAYVKTVPSWPALLPDGTHPNATLAGLVARDVLLPKLPPCGGTE